MRDSHYEKRVSKCKIDASQTEMAGIGKPTREMYPRERFSTNFNDTQRKGKVTWKRKMTDTLSLGSNIESLERQCIAFRRFNRHQQHNSSSWLQWLTIPLEYSPIFFQKFTYIFFDLINRVKCNRISSHFQIQNEHSSRIRSIFWMKQYRFFKIWEMFLNWTTSVLFINDQLMLQFIRFKICREHYLSALTICLLNISNQSFWTRFFNIFVWHLRMLFEWKKAHSVWISCKKRAIRICSNLRLFRSKSPVHMKDNDCMILAHSARRLTSTHFIERLDASPHTCLWK